MAHTMGHTCARMGKLDFASEARFKADRKASVVTPRDLEDVLVAADQEELAASLEIVHPVFGRIVNGVFHSA